MSLRNSVFLMDRVFFLLMIGTAAVCLLARPHAASAQVDKAANRPEAMSAEEITQFVKDLNSDRFVDRERATEKLAGAGFAAIDPIVKALATNDLEVTTRGIQILRELALSLDPKTEASAREALERIAKPRVTSSARHAAAALAMLDAVRQERALEQLRELGATVTTQNSEIDNATRHVIEIGESWRGKDEDLNRLRWLRDVDEVILDGPKVNDEWLKFASGVQEISALSIKRAPITDEGVKHLGKLTGVTTLSLMYVPVTDKSIETLKQIDGASEIRIFGTKISRGAADELQNALTSTKIDYRQGAFLGISCQPTNNDGCVVYTVRPNTAAEKAGLQAGDTILKYDGKDVADFDGLTALISNNAPGDKVVIKIQRGGVVVDKEVKFGEWE